MTKSIKNMSDDDKINHPIVKLYRCSDGNPKTDVYVYTTYKKYIRNLHTYADHGGMDEGQFIKVLSTGFISQIKSLKEIPENDWFREPFCTDEIWVTDNISDFFSTKKDERL